MSAPKRAINQLLDRVTGHRIVAASTLESVKDEKRRNESRAQEIELLLKQARARQRQTKALLDRLDAQVGRIEQLTKPKPPPTIPNDYDPAMKEIWPRVKDRTMTTPLKTNTLVETVRYIERCAIPGAIVECGVWRGGSMLAIVETLLRLGVSDRDLYLFDTYTGMAEPSEKDVHIHNGLPAARLLEEKVGGARIWEPASLEDVRSAFEQVPYPDERLHFVVGKVEETVPEEAPEQIALLRLDTDWYESTKHELEHLYPRLAPGGVLIIDDYGSWQGSKDATDEFFQATGEPIMLVRVDRSRVAVKPGLSSTVAQLSVDMASSQVR